MCLCALVRCSCFSETPTVGTCVFMTNKNYHTSLLVHQTGAWLEGGGEFTFLMWTSQRNGQSGRAQDILFLKWTLAQEQRGMDVMKQEVQRQDDWSGVAKSSAFCQQLSKVTIAIKPSIKPLINGKNIFLVRVQCSHSLPQCALDIIRVFSREHQ